MLFEKYRSFQSLTMMETYLLNNDINGVCVSTELEEKGIQDFKIFEDGQLSIFDMNYDTSYFSDLFVKNQLKLYQNTL